jgi:hypothetical protein
MIRSIALWAVAAIPSALSGLAFAAAIGGPKYEIVTNGSLYQGGNTVQRLCDHCGPPGGDQQVAAVAAVYVLAAGGIWLAGRRPGRALQSR